MNRLETITLTLWESSLACRGFMPYIAGQTFQSMIERLEPLRIQGEFHKVRIQASELVDMLVHDIQERPKQTSCEIHKLHMDLQATNPCSEIILSSRSY